MAFTKLRQNPQIIKQDTYKLLFNLYYNKAYRTAYMITKDYALAEDIVQESFIKAFRNIHQLRDVDKFASWLTTIIKNTAINLFCKNNNTVPVDDVEKIIPFLREISQSDKSLDDIIINKELKTIVFNAVMGLNDKYKDIFIFRYYSGFSYEQIAAELNMSVGTVKSRLSRGREIIRQVLLEYLEEYREGERKDGALR